MAHVRTNLGERRRRKRAEDGVRGADGASVGHDGAAMIDPTPAHHRAPHVHDDVDQRIDAALELLREDGGRVTTARRAIVTSLYRGQDHHVTAEDVAAAVQAQHPDVHLSTVYRTLDALERLAVVAKVDLGPGPAVYHLVDHVHHHLVCDRCGTVIEVPGKVIEPLAAALEARVGFVASPHRLTISGLCRSCR